MNKSAKDDAHWRVSATVKMTSAASTMSLNRFLMIHEVYKAGIVDLPPEMRNDAAWIAIPREEAERAHLIQERKIEVFIRGINDMIDGGWIDRDGIKAAVLHAEEINRSYHGRIRPDPTGHADCARWVATALAYAADKDGADKAYLILSAAITALNSAVMVDVAIAMPGGVVLMMSMEDGFLRSGERAVKEMVRQGAPDSAIKKAREHMAGADVAAAIFN